LPAPSFHTHDNIESSLVSSEQLCGVGEPFSELGIRISSRQRETDANSVASLARGGQCSKSWTPLFTLQERGG